MGLLTERHINQLKGVISCFDRVILTGTIPEICHPQALRSYMNRQKIKIFDYPKWAQPFRDEIRANAEKLAQENGLKIEFIRRYKDFRKEERVKEIVAARGSRPGLVHIFSAMEGCPSFIPWYDKSTGQSFFKRTEAKCLHYYFYFIDEQLGLCYLRVPTWSPFRLQFYFNGHNYLATQLENRRVEYQLIDNAFVDIADFGKAQKLADSFRVDRLHGRLKRLAFTYCPVIRHFSSNYHWSIMQLEYATDIIFKQKKDLEHLYETLTRTAVHTVKVEHIATFLGRKLNGNYQGEMGNDYSIRIEGTRIRHQMGPVAIKMYDKLGLVLRIETTTNDVTFFKHHRRVEHRDGSWEMKVAHAKKSIYSLPALRELMSDANHRYLEFISTMEEPTSGAKNLNKLSQRVREGEHTYRGFNLFDCEDLALFEALLRGEFNISGFTSRRLRMLLNGKTGSQISRILKRLRTHGLIKKIGRTYKYYLTCLGRRVIMAALHLRQMITPTLATATTDY